MAHRAVPQPAVRLIGLQTSLPYAIHTALTGNGIPAKPRSSPKRAAFAAGLRAFANRARDIWDSQHIFGRVCDEHEIEHRLTKVNHPWTNGSGSTRHITPRD